jgi:hypothetical protein
MIKEVPNGKVRSVLATVWHEVIIAIKIDGSWDLANEVGEREEQ